MTGRVWRKVHGKRLAVGMLVQFGNVAFVVTSLETDTRYGITTTDMRLKRRGFEPERNVVRVYSTHPYRVRFTAPVNRGGVPVILPESEW